MGVGCDEVATNALGYYHPDIPSLYACPDHTSWLPSQWNGGNDPIYYKLVGGFDPRDNTLEEIDEAIQVLVKAGVMDYIPPPPPFVPRPADNDF